MGDSKMAVQSASDDGPSPTTGGIPGLANMSSGLQHRRKPTEKACQAAELIQMKTMMDDCFFSGKAVPPHHRWTIY